jgi:hypothetical protein
VSRREQADAVWHAAMPLIERATSSMDEAVFEDLSFSYTDRELVVTSGFPQHLILARQRLFPVFTKAGWVCSEDVARGRNRLVLRRNFLRVV